METTKVVWEFKLHQHVKLVESEEAGTVVGRAEYTNSPNNYLVRYRAGDGRQTEAWWTADALMAC
jgi:hypothetical protein